MSPNTVLFMIALALFACCTELACALKPRGNQVRVSRVLPLRTAKSDQLPELSDKKMDATNAPPEPTLKHAKMIILLVKIRLFSLESQSCLSCVCTCILPLKLKLYSAGIGSD